MRVYYNDSDPFVCAWLRNLITAKLLPAGDVDERPIEHVQASDVAGYTQAHFFAGIGGWPYALQLAGWGDRPIWTGSCPCQPFSAAGKGKAEDDPRHLWPHWFRLIREQRPKRVFGEQVANSVGKGWWDVVSTELEAEAYTVGAVVLGSHSVGAPHLRQRLWFVGDTTGARREGGQAQRSQCAETRFTGPTARSGTSELADTKRRPTERRGHDVGSAPRDAESETRERQRIWADPWAGCEFIPCRDGKARPVEPGTFPLAHGIPQRVGRLRAYGNAIIPQVAAAFVSAYMDVVDFGGTRGEAE